MAYILGLPKTGVIFEEYTRRNKEIQKNRFNYDTTKYFFIEKDKKYMFAKFYFEEQKRSSQCPG